MFFDSPLKVPYLSTIGHTVENVSKDVLGATSCKQLPLGTGKLYCMVVSPQFTRHTTWGCMHTMHNAKHWNSQGEQKRDHKICKLMHAMQKAASSLSRGTWWTC